MAPPGRERTSIPHIERVPNSSVRGEVRLSEEAQDVSAPRVSRPPGQPADKAWLLNELEEQVRPRIRELLLRRAAPRRILWRFTEALASELGRIRLPLSELEEDNLAFCVADALRCSGNVDRLERGEDGLEAFNFEREFGDVQRCLRCRQVRDEPVDRESRLCSLCTCEVWYGGVPAGFELSRGGRLTPAEPGTGVQSPCGSEEPPSVAERAQIRDRIAELHRRDDQLADVQRLQEGAAARSPA